MSERYSWNFPPGYDDESWIWESKGYLPIEIEDRGSGKRMEVVFTNPVRLGQDLEEELRQGEPWVQVLNTVVVDSVGREEVVAALQGLAQAGWLQRFHVAE